MQEQSTWTWFEKNAKFQTCLSMKSKKIRKKILRISSTRVKNAMKESANDENQRCKQEIFAIRALACIEIRHKQLYFEMQRMQSRGIKKFQIIQMLFRSLQSKKERKFLKNELGSFKSINRKVSCSVVASYSWKNPKNFSVFFVVKIQFCIFAGVL